DTWYIKDSNDNIIDEGIQRNDNNKSARQVWWMQMASEGRYIRLCSTPQSDLSSSSP
ncbi:hypothetical protein KI387_007135, partial [Taxus chinensis]